ncbi:hypothetical protein [Humisphaera borealis]|uniref:Uncharacterized protein n=1 Tax=Humisphaera borealis TaxID=2807512 RepID=A0A7M2WPU8_9BACT|nr:hypothetical protein [Humisphaera borealis]QOV87429.1 hypothetical protein IPV69_14130 [Humisphaera borealis]
MLQRKKPKRLYSAVAAIGGVIFLAFELGKWSTSSPEKWFWAFIAILMIVLGFIGVVQRDVDQGA